MNDLRSDLENFYRWLWPKFEWQIIMAAAVGVGLLGLWAYLELTKPAGSSGGQGGYRYPGLPSACRCGTCGHVVENPGVHCKDLACPKCGGRMWRVK